MRSPRVVQALAAAGVNHAPHAVARHRAVGRSARLRRGRRCRAAGSRRRIPRASAPSRGRYRARYGQDPVRTATLAYDAVALVAALVKTQGAARFSEEVLTNPSGFAGIDGVFRFRPDGTNQRGLAVMRVTTSGRAGGQPGAAGVQRAGTSERIRNGFRTIALKRLTPPDRPPRRRAREARARDAQAAVGRFDQPFAAERRDARLDRAAGRRAPRSARDRCLRRAAGPSADIRRPARAGQRLVGDDAVAARLDAHQPAFPGASRSTVAWRAPSMSRRPCAPGPMPAYSWSRQ